MSYYTRSRVSTALYSPLIENGYEISNDGKKLAILALQSACYLIKHYYVSG